MSSLDELTSRQEETGQEIKRICTGYKKDSSSRKTEEYLKTKLKSLRALWDDFQTTDDIIRAHYSSSIDHSYFTKDYYNIISSGFENVLQDINMRLKTLGKPESSREPARQLPHAATHTQGELADLQGVADDTAGARAPTTGIGSFTQGLTQESSTVNNDGDKFSMGAISKMSSRTTKLEGSDQRNNICGTIRRQRSLIHSLERILKGLPAQLREQSTDFLEIKIKSIEQYWSQIQHLHQAVWESTGEPETFGYDENTYFDLEEQVHINLIQLHEAARHERNIHRGSNAPAQANTILPSMKLPKIVLSKFDGDYLKWRQFRDLFTELVHNQPIADCQKIWYLKTSLCGEAERLVRHLTTSDANYATAWRIINERYENIRLLVTALINKLLGQCQINNESAHAIRTMHDTTQECLLALANLGVATDQWDPLLLHILIKKTDKNTHTLWEQSLRNPRALQSLKEFLEFLETRFQSLEALGTKGKASEETPRRPHAKSLTSTVTTDIKCPTCKGNHQVFNCPNLLQAPPSKRYNLIKSIKACINCLKSGHTVTRCPSSSTCRKCNKRHNTLLHMQDKPDIPDPNLNSTDKAESAQKMATINQQSNRQSADSISLTAKITPTARSHVLLSTVRLDLIASNGSIVSARAILDSGSQLNFITEKMAKRLGLTGTSAYMIIEGIGKGRQQSQRQINLTIQSRINNFSKRLLAHVLPQIISPQPAQAIDISAWPLPRNIQLADPRFSYPDSIDLLIGAELYYSLLCVGQIKLGENLPVLQNTVFGWAVAGRVQKGIDNSAVCGICSEDEALDIQIEKFWRLETPTEHNNLTASERRCETFFDQTTTRDEAGRFIVRLPFQGDPTSLGESKDIALQRFMAVERRLARHEDLREQYVKFMNEYLELGHMKEINFNEVKRPYFFLPHHCVVKPDSTTTKLRVVFDGSAKTSTNISLNDILSTGPTVQDDVFSHLLRFRMPRYVFTADIEKMYRQMRVYDTDQRYQLIWWRNDPHQRIKCFQLTTVTYGTTSAPYLATKSLQRLADETKDQYPLGAEVLRRDFYVDDILTGSDSIGTAVEIQAQVQAILKSAGMTLRKWCANNPRMLQNIAAMDQELKLDFDSKDEDSIKTIGLTWLPKSDQFSIRTSWKKHDQITKRTAYSDIAHLFDPLGIMSPVIVLAKLFLQRLWSIKLDWDAALPQEMYTYWMNFRNGLAALNDIKFERHIFAHRTPKSVQYHIFADASEKAYGAAVYVRSADKANLITVRLLCAKSRVAPTKQITLPRLELCAAKLAAELATRITKDLSIKHHPVYLWTDSEIVLHWINSQSSSFHTFVANRVSSIQQLTSPDQWRHVTSNQNPADVLSRGITPEKLASCNLWFYGPPFLHGSTMSWPPPYTKKHVEDDSEKKKKAVAATAINGSTNIIATIDHHNSFKRLQRIVGYMLRFINKGRGKTNTSHIWLSTLELGAAQASIIRIMQQKEFKEDISYLERFGEVAKTSAISSLAPFLDHKGIVRVGGRLEHSSLPYNARHPILLPYSHPLTKLLINEVHTENLHVGAQTLLSIVRQNFWPIKGKILTRSIVQHCIQCSRTKPKLSHQLMGNLPRDRVEPARPFANTGIDFCGPVWVHFKIRGKRPVKAYIAVFCCFATKATHLEVVSDLSTQGFIWALKRFIGRRGHCKTIYCDNGTNFVGARNQLEEIKQMLESSSTQETIASSCSSKGIEFKFIPPRAPHFGGLWEATVKSAKHLLQKTLLSASLTHEELETAVVEAEAILNSRPLTPMSTSPNDLTAITPAHFLIGEPLTTPIDADVEPLRGNLLSRWKLIAHIKSEFWRRWSSEYLNHLQQRYKWKNKVENIQPGTMVILKEDNTPPLKWPLGRIINIIKGSDGLVRVADVRTASGILRRAVHKLAPLPIEEDATNSASEDSGQVTKSSDTGAETGSNLTTINHNPVSSTAISMPDRPSSAPRKKQRLSLGSAVVTLLLTSLFLPSTTSSPIEISRFTTQPGIFFENLGIANSMTSKWNLVLYYDMGPYWKEYAYITNCTRNLDKLCKLMTDHEPCLRILENIKHVHSELVDNNEVLLPAQQGRRVKRGAINIVGNVANSLFGILDSEYAEQMAQTIDNVQINEDHLLHLIKNQTTIIDATMNLMKHESETTEKHFRQLEDHLTELSKQLNNVHEEHYQDRIYQSFVMLAMQLILSLSKYQKAQGDIMDVLADTQHGKINPQLISPRQLREEVVKIKGMLPSSLKMPQFQDDMLRLYNLMTIEGRPTIKYIIFQIKLPLLALEDFELYKLTPVPVFMNNTFIAVRPSANFFIINLHRDQYCSMDDLSSCVSVVHDNYICEQRKPMFQKGSTIGACEIGYFNEDGQSSTCELMNVGPGPHWIQLHTPNQWMYSVQEPTTINVVCGTNVTQYTLVGAGRLTIQPKCVIKQRFLTIQSHNIYPTSARTSYLPSGNLTDMITPERLAPTFLYASSNTSHLIELEKLRRDLLNLQTELPAKIQQHDYHQFAVGYIGLTLTAMIIGFFIWKFWSTCVTRTKKEDTTIKDTQDPDDPEAPARLEVRSTSSLSISQF